MKKNLALETMLILLFLGIALALTVQQAESIVTIYINADGSITPADAPISTLDKITYTLTSNIFSEGSGITILRDNIVLDGAGFTLQGSRTGIGVYLYSVNYVTVMNLNIEEFSYNVQLFDSVGSTIRGCNVTNAGIWIFLAQNNLITGNNISGSNYGVYVSGTTNPSRYNSISRNNIMLSSSYGVYLDLYSTFNSISANNVTQCGTAIHLNGANSNTISGNNLLNNGGHGVRVTGKESYNNTVSGNKVANNGEAGIYLAEYRGACLNNELVSNGQVGIWLRSEGVTTSRENRVIANNVSASPVGIMANGSWNNVLYHNNVFGNTRQVVSDSLPANTWDNGYPSGGNYWSDYTGTDLYNGPNQDEAGSDGIGDTPYTINANNKDRYPLIAPFDTPRPQLPTYTLTITTAEGGTTNPAPGAYQYPKWQTVTVSASSDPSYTFDHWELDNQNVGSGASYTVTMNSDHTLTAFFAPPSAPEFPLGSATYIAPIAILLYLWWRRKNRGTP